MNKALVEMTEYEVGSGPSDSGQMRILEGPTSGMDTGLSSKTFGQFCKYCVVAGAGTILDFVLYSTLILTTSVYYLLANAASYLTTAIVMYYLQKNWTFQYRGGGAWLMTKFTMLVAFSYVMSNVVLFVLVGILLLNPIPSKAIQIVVGALWGFAISKYLVYR